MDCRVCASKKLRLVLDLSNQPRGNQFLKKEEVGLEKAYPLKLMYCLDCQTAQLDYTVKKEEVYLDHTYLSGVTQTLKKHFKEVAQQLDNRFFKNQKHKTVLDIGSNDGTQLQFFKELGYEIVGFEPCKTIAKIANQADLFTVCDFFNLASADRMNTMFDVINAAGVFFHLEQLHSVCEAIRKYLKPKGVLVVQFLYMKNIMENGAFDQIYHEHLLYYTLQTIQTLLKQYGLSLFDARISPIHGGSAIAYISHQGEREPTKQLLQLQHEEAISGCNELSAYQKFAQKTQELKKRELLFLNSLKQQGKTIFGFGAPVKGNTLLNYFGIDSKIMDVLVEKNELRNHLFSPGMHIPIILEKDVQALPDVYYVLAWNFKEEILKNNAQLLKEGVEFYFPICPAIETKVS